MTWRVTRANEEPLPEPRIRPDGMTIPPVQEWAKTAALGAGCGSGVAPGLPRVRPVVQGRPVDAQSGTAVASECAMGRWARDKASRTLARIARVSPR